MTQAVRYYSIDVLRAVAIVIMVVVHFGENLSGVNSPLAGFGAPLFAFLSGVSYCLWVKGQEAKDVADGVISQTTLRRGLFVIAVGFLFNVLVWLPEDLFNWDVLTFIGSALLTLNVVRKAPAAVLLSAAAAALLVSPVLRRLADYDAYWVNRYFECDWTPSEICIGFLATGYFPYFPWIAYSLVGFVTGGALFADEPESAGRRAIVWTFESGIAASLVSVCALGTFAMLPKDATRGMLGGWTMFPPTMEYVSGTLGMTLIAVAVAHRAIDCSAAAERFAPVWKAAQVFSRNAFTIYVLHHIVHLWPLWIYAWWHGQEPTFYWMQATPLSVSIPLAFLFLVGSYVLLSRTDRIYGIEYWMRWWCD